MSYQNPLSTIEQQAIENELETLFACNGKTLGREMKAIWIKEIDKSFIHPKAILQGIISLKNDEINSIKLNLIFHAARKYTEFESFENCNNCSDGFIIMKDEEGRYFSLACKCPAGKFDLTRWAGLNSQFSKGRILNKINFYLDK